MMSYELFTENLIEILNEGTVENIDIDNMDYIISVFIDKRINEMLYKQFKNNYENEYGNNLDMCYSKVQDMVYRVNLLINHCLIDEYEIGNIKDIMINLIKDENISFTDAVSYDDSDLEIIKDYKDSLSDLLSKRDI